MNLDRFIRLLDTYGSRIERWPEAERAAARAFVEADDLARRRWMAARDLDAVIAADRPQISEERVRAVLARAFDEIHAPPRRSEWRFLLSPRLGAMLAATLALGWFAGTAIQPPLHHAGSEPGSVLGSVLAGPQSGLEGFIQ